MPALQPVYNISSDNEDEDNQTDTESVSEFNSELELSDAENEGNQSDIENDGNDNNDDAEPPIHWLMPAQLEALQYGIPYNAAVAVAAQQLPAAPAQPPLHFVYEGAAGWGPNDNDHDPAQFNNISGPMNNPGQN